MQQFIELERSLSFQVCALKTTIFFLVFILNILVSMNVNCDWNELVRETQNVFIFWLKGPFECQLFFSIGDWEFIFFFLYFNGIKIIIKSIQRPNYKWYFWRRDAKGKMNEYFVFFLTHSFAVILFSSGCHQIGLVVWYIFVVSG